MARGSRARARARPRNNGTPGSADRPEDEEDVGDKTEESPEDDNVEEKEDTKETEVSEENKEVKVDRRKPQLKTKQEPEPTPEPSPQSAKKGGRTAPVKRGRGGSTSTPNAVKTEPNSATNDGEQSETKTEDDSEPSRKRSRKTKEPVKEEDKFVPNIDSNRRGIVADGVTSLRRRDQIKSKTRYSPPPFDTPRRERATIKFPSTTSSSRYVNESDDEETVSVSPTFKLSSDVSPPRRKAANTRGGDSVKTIQNVGVAKIGDGSKLVVTLPDGSTVKVDASSSSKKVAFKGQKVGDKSIEIDFDDDGAKSDPYDDDYRPSRARKRPDEAKKDGDKPRMIQTYSKATPKQAVAPKQLLAISQTQLKSNMSGGKPIGDKITPKFVTTPGQNKTTPRTATNRRTTPMTKYIDGMPDINECTLDVENDSQMTKLPDKILLLHSELPLKLALSVEHEDEAFLFRQIVSPMENNRYVCLLCKGIEVSYATKEEKDIISHYKTLHELEVVTANAKFSEDIVFICLPKSILEQLTSNKNSIPLNAPCQYCGDEVRLINIENMKQHYCLEHNKEVTMIEQEEILKMHLFFYCSQCKHQSTNFEAHHKHMKDEHKMKSYKCKNCVLITQDLTRLKTHFRAKHMINSANQNMQCYYCHGLLIGLDRLNKHIQQSHMVQTGPTEFSCVACLKPCGRGKDLLVHAQNCPKAGINNKDKDDKSKQALTKVEPNPDTENEAAICFLCGDEFESNEICLLHQHHVHMKWVSDLKRYTNSSTDLTDLQPKELTIEDLTPEDQLRKSKVETIVGHWCRMCDQMVKVYRLYYLHMANYHKLDKEFQCNVSNCKMQFTSAEAFQEHMLQTNHTQKTIISHPDEVFVCAYCDLYFGSDDDLVAHLITDQHINKFTASGHFHRTEPRNYKCKACHTFFGMKESYIHHLETEPHQYNCPYCGISTATPSSRRAHIQNTHPDKLQICEECNEPQSDVLAHFVTHGFAFECKKCIKKFYNREQLNAHMEVHQDPIICNWEDCGRAITTRSMLVTHYRGHKSEHKCNVCGQAFWNINMLNSHQRSHQNIQKVMPQSLTPQRPPPGRPTATKSPMIQSVPRNDTNLIKFPSPLNATQLKTKGGFQTTIGGLTSKSPQVSSTIIKCGHCSALFKNPKDLAGHKCVKLTPKEALPEESKLLELAAKASQVAKPSAKPRSRRQPPKKMVQQQPVIDLNALTAAQGIATPAEDGTQVIMILNQETGELMEITAPQGMAVSEVINSLNFVRPNVGESLTIAANGSDSIAFGQQQEIQVQQGPDESAQASAEVSQELQSMGEEGAQEQTIMLPANCFNEDGSLTLDAATLASLNLGIAVDNNGELTTDGNTTFIIDTSQNR